MPKNSIHLHRILRATPDLVYKAFLTPEALVKFLPTNGFVAKVHRMEPKVGGVYKISFINLATGAEHAFGGTYLELVPDKKIVNTDVFDDPNLPGTLKTTVLIHEVSCGVELEILQEGIPPAIPPELCYLGWQESLALLALLVEAKLPE
jgi:uncharacterized protein YndB with AHSA1/START domain